MDTRTPLGNIVVATDFTDHAGLALDRALQLPLGPGSLIDLVHVCSETDRVEATRLLDELRVDAARRLQARGTNIEVVTSLDHGTPFAVITDHAHHSRAELVVLGRHGERRFREALIGSTAERVIRHGSVSVLVVGSPPQRPYRRPLVAVDGSESSRLALVLAARICDPALHEIDVLHVVSMPSRLHTSETRLVPALERRLDQLKQEARAELAELLAAVDLGVRWNLVVESGDSRSVISDEARSRGADVIAIGTKGRTGLARVLLGSVAEGVMRAAPCDVLIARLPEKP
jgi:nucleotide-binding universal stress UspA family protein